MHLADHLGRRLQGLVARILPFGGANLGWVLGQVQVGLHLPQQLVHVAAEVEKVDFAVHQHAFRADDEGPARDLRSGEAIDSSAHFPISVLNPGDLLVTSGLDGIFPAGLEVAIVTKVHLLREGASSYELEATPAIANMHDLVDVWVLPPAVGKKQEF